MTIKPEAGATGDVNKPTQQRFLRDVAQHRIAVIRDDGIYRHLQFSRPGTYCMGFDIVTWPGYLCYCGDMGEFLFTRLPDMFEFFRTALRDDGDLHINPSYWGEKCVAADKHDGLRTYSAELFREAIATRLDEMDADDELRQAVEDEVLPAAHDGETVAHIAARDFTHDGEFVFPDFWEANLTDYTYRFIWCCFALAWGIRQYDAMTTRAAAVPESVPTALNTHEAQAKSSEVCDGKAV
jgi:hypothetical protein